MLFGTIDLFLLSIPRKRREVTIGFGWIGLGVWAWDVERAIMTRTNGGRHFERKRIYLLFVLFFIRSRLASIIFIYCSLVGSGW